jgi:hypothetical protein
MILQSRLIFIECAGGGVYPYGINRRGRVNNSLQRYEKSSSLSSKDEIPPGNPQKSRTLKQSPKGKTNQPEPSKVRNSR